MRKLFQRGVTITWLHAFKWHLFKLQPQVFHIIAFFLEQEKKIFLLNCKIDLSNSTILK